MLVAQSPLQLAHRAHERIKLEGLGLQSPSRSHKQRDAYLCLPCELIGAHQLCAAREDMTHATLDSSVRPGTVSAQVTSHFKHKKVCNETPEPLNPVHVALNDEARGHFLRYRNQLNEATPR